jgi:hypothetical protein
VRDEVSELFSSFCPVTGQAGGDPIVHHHVTVHKGKKKSKVSIHQRHQKNIENASTRTKRGLLGREVSPYIPPVSTPDSALRHTIVVPSIPHHLRDKVVDGPARADLEVKGPDGRIRHPVLVHDDQEEGAAGVSDHVEAHGSRVGSAGRWTSGFGCTGASDGRCPDCAQSVGCRRPSVAGSAVGSFETVIVGLVFFFFFFFLVGGGGL